MREREREEISSYKTDGCGSAQEPLLIRCKLLPIRQSPQNKAKLARNQLFSKTNKLAVRYSLSLSLSLPVYFSLFRLSLTQGCMVPNSHYTADSFNECRICSFLFSHIYLSNHRITATSERQERVLYMCECRGSKVSLSHAQEQYTRKSCKTHVTIMQHTHTHTHTHTQRERERKRERERERVSNR